MTARDVMTLNGVTFDADTGEILDDIPGDRVGWLAAQLAKAQAQIKGWQQAEIILKQNIEQEYVATGVRSVATEYGTPRLMLGTETADVALVKDAALSLFAEDAVGAAEFYRACANGFNAKLVKDWLGPRIGLEAVDALMRRGKDYIRLDPPRDEAPRVRKVEA